MRDGLHSGLNWFGLLGGNGAKTVSIVESTAHALYTKVPRVPWNLVVLARSRAGELLGLLI